MSVEMGEVDTERTGVRDLGTKLELQLARIDKAIAFEAGGEHAVGVDERRHT